MISGSQNVLPLLSCNLEIYFVYYIVRVFALNEMEALKLASKGTKKTTATAKGVNSKKGNAAAEDTGFLQSEITILGTFAICVFLFFCFLVLLHVQHQSFEEFTLWAKG